MLILFVNFEAKKCVFFLIGNRYLLGNHQRSGQNHCTLKRACSSASLVPDLLLCEDFFPIPACRRSKDVRSVQDAEAGVGPAAAAAGRPRHRRQRTEATPQPPRVSG
jgi:hypothetical protein